VAAQGGRDRGDDGGAGGGSARHAAGSIGYYCNEPITMLDDKNAVLAVRPARGEKLGVLVRRGHPDGAVEGVETFPRLVPRQTHDWDQRWGPPRPIPRVSQRFR